MPRDGAPPAPRGLGRPPHRPAPLGSVAYAGASFETLEGRALLAATTIDFDTDGTWTQGSAGFTSHASDRVYVESGWSFTGGPALRNTTTATDGVAGALGTYSWRLRDTTTTSWTATYVAGGSLSAFGFDVRR